MADDITELRERVAKLEATLVHYATGTELAEVRRDSANAAEVGRLYIDRETFHNNALGIRVTDLEKAFSAFSAATRENIGLAKALAGGALAMVTGLGVTLLAAVITGFFR